MLAILLLSTQPIQPCIEGIASYYSTSKVNIITASGERFNDREYTCAMPFGTFGDYYLIVNEATGKAVVCKLNDRGPFIKGRVIDLSHTAMRALDSRRGLIKVKVYHLGKHPVQTGPVTLPHSQSIPKIH